MSTLIETRCRRSIAEPKVSLKAENKRLRKHLMLFIVLFAFLPISHAQQQQKFGPFQDQYINKVDVSSIRTCWTLGGLKIEPVDSSNAEMGFKCTVRLDVPSDDDRHAKENCESRIPFYVIGSKVDQNYKSKTQCTFQINLSCEPDYWQIRGKCYKVTSTRYTWAQAEKVCKVDKLVASGRDPKIAEYYYRGLNNYLSDIINVYDAWVFVPELKDYYKNAQGNAAFYVQEGAYKYDARRGDILMDNLDEKHQVICEYTPEMTMAELYYIGEIYSEIYDVQVYHGGAIIPSANLETIKHKSSINGQPLFTTENLKEKCMAVGRILNVDSYPIIPIEGEFNDVKDYLKNQRYYLTNAYKNDGNDRSNYKHTDATGNEFPLDENVNSKDDVEKAHSYSISQSGRYPSMASMRAPILCTLHTFKWKYGACAKGPAWSEEPITFTRKNGQIFCHYVNNKKFATITEATAECESFGAALTGFDSAEEFELVNKMVKPKYPLGSDIRKGPVNGKIWTAANVIINGRWQKIDNHYWLGGKSPCEVDCNLSDGKEEVASWNKGVALNTKFLNNYNHVGYDWKTLTVDQFVAFRADENAFHVHHAPVPYTYMFFICGTSAPLERGERLKSKAS